MLSDIEKNKNDVCFYLKSGESLNLAANSIANVIISKNFNDSIE